MKCTPHKNRTGGKVKGSKAPDSDGVLRIATNLLYVPAEIIAILYSYRWTVEVFFRFYKQLMGGAHLISHSQNGIEIQVYCAMITCLVMNLWVGGNPTLRDKVQHDAYRWFFSPGSDFKAWCEMAGLDVDFVRERAQKIYDEGLPEWRAAAGKGALYEKRKAYRLRAKK